MRTYLSLTAIILLFFWVGCGGPTPPTPSNAKLIFKIRLDSTQTRLNNLGQPSSIPTGHAALSPKFNSIAAHYIELTPNALTALGAGEVVYLGKETTAGGTNAIVFDSLRKVKDGDVLFEIPLSKVKTGTFEYLRVSLAYQNYDIPFLFKQSGATFNFTGTIASFVGYNTYIKNYVVKTQSISLNANKQQGYWGFELPAQPQWGLAAQTQQGQAPPGATTVVNPLFATSPIPAGSCVVTAKFPEKLTLTGNETQDVVVTVSLSTNKSFEWIDNTADGKFEPAAGEVVVDMGIRGMVLAVQK